MEVRKVCLFCKTDEDNELLYGKIYELDGEIVTHYFCLLLSSNMEQNGGDNEGILGFLKEDILKEFRRGKRITCWYCKRAGATVGCCMSRCKKVFHLPCGRREGSLHQFFRQFKSYCASHRPLQKISPDVLMEVKDMTATCTICCDDVYPRDYLSTLWAPCCSKNAWFHRDCVQRLALSAGYFFKCPLCNNKIEFQKAMLDFGIYIPEQDASWELEPNAYQDLLHRHNRCDAKHCVCPKGRSHAMVGTRWELALCKYCGSQGIHVGCGNLKWSNPEWECDGCTSMLQQAQEGCDVNSDEEPRPSPATVNKLPARRKRRYFKGRGGTRRTKYRKQSVLSSSSHPHPSSSQSPVMPRGGPTAMTDGPVSPPTPISVIEVSDDEIIEILDDDGDDDDDDDDDESSGKTSTPGDCTMILSCDGKPIPVIKVATITTTDSRQNLCVVGDLNVRLPCHLYDVQQIAQPAASNRRMSHISGAMVPVSSVDSSLSKSLHSFVDGSSSSKPLHSSVDGSSSSKPLHSSVEGSSSSRSLHSSVEGSSSSRSLHSSVEGSISSRSLHSSVEGSSSSKSLLSSVDGRSSNTSVYSSPASSHSQPSASGTARGSLLKSYLTIENPQGGHAYPAQVPIVAQQLDNKTPARTESQNPNTRSVQRSAPRTSSHDTEVLPSSRVCNRPHGDGYNQQHGSCIDTQSQQESRHLGNRLTGHHVLETLGYLSVTSPKKMQVEGVDHNIMTVYLPLAPVQKLLRNHVIETASAVPQNVIAAIIDSNILTPQFPHLKNPEQSTMCSGQEGSVGESCPESWVDYSCSERSVDDTYSEIKVGESCSERGLSEIGVGDFYSERGLLETEVGDTYSEGAFSEMQVGFSYSESGLSDTYSDIGVEDSQTESKFNSHLPVTSYSPIVTRSRSRCVLHSNAHMTRSLIKKIQESRFPSCRCETCMETKEMLGQKDWKVHKDSNSSFSVGEMISGRCRSGSSSRGTPHRRRSRSLSLSRNTRKRHSSHNTFSNAAYSEYDSCSEKGLSDACSVMGLSDTYSEIGVDDSQSEQQFDCHLPVTSYSPTVTRSRSRCVLHSNTRLTRSLTKTMLGKKDWEIHKDSSSIFSLGEMIRGRRRSGSSSRGAPRRRRRKRRRRRRRSGSLSLSRKPGKRHSSHNTFSSAEVAVCSYSECESYLERELGDACSVMGLSDTYSEIGVDDSQTEQQFDCNLSDTSYSPIVTRSRSRCVLNSNTRLTRSLTKMMQEGRFPSCRCETCRETKKTLGKEDGKVRKDSKVKLSRSVPHSEAVSRRRGRSVGSSGGMQDRRNRRHNWGRNTIQNSDRSLAFMNRSRAGMQVKNELGIKREYVIEEVGYLSNDMYELNVTGNSQSGVVCNSGTGVSEVAGIDCSSSNILQHYSSENMEKEMCCINMGSGVEGTSLSKRTQNCPTFCGCLNGVSKREEALRVRKIFSVPHRRRRRMEELEHSYILHDTEMASGFMTD